RTIIPLTGTAMLMDSVSKYRQGANRLRCSRARVKCTSGLDALALVSSLLLGSCGNTVEPGPQADAASGVSTAAGAGGASSSGTGGMAASCPQLPPEPGSTCASPGLECPYPCCNTFRCQGSYWARLPEQCSNSCPNAIPDDGSPCCFSVCYYDLC